MALVKNPDYLKVIKRKSLCLRKLEKYEEAVQVLQEALDIHPDDNGTLSLSLARYNV